MMMSGHPVRAARNRGTQQRISRLFHIREQLKLGDTENPACFTHTWLTCYRVQRFAVSSRVTVRHCGGSRVTVCALCGVRWFYYPVDVLQRN